MHFRNALNGSAATARIARAAVGQGLRPRAPRGGGSAALPAWIVAFFGAVLGGSVLCGPAVAQEKPGSGWYPAAGVHWARPSDAQTRDLYSGALSYFGAMGYGWPERLRVEVRMDWFRQTGHPANVLANTSRARLTLTPIALEIHGNLGRGKLRPYLLAGGGVLFSEEQFTFGMFDNPTRTSGRRKDLMGVFGGGLESRQEGVILRAAARVLLSKGGRDVVRATGRTDSREGNSGSPSLFTLGLELQLR